MTAKPLRVTLHLPLTVHPNPYRYGDPDMYALEDRRIPGVAYGSPAQAKRKLKAEAEDAISTALDAKQADDVCTLVVTNEGTILVVRWHYGWGYKHYGPERRGSSCTGFDTSGEAIKAAREHAAQVFGGVAWECGA